MNSWPLARPASSDPASPGERAAQSAPRPPVRQTGCASVQDMSARRYGEPRERAPLELRAAAAQFIVEAELMLRWLDQLVGEPPPTHELEDRHAHVLGCARSVEAALNHLVALERLAAEAPPPHESSHAHAAEAKKRRTIPIVGDPDKAKPEPEHAPPSPTPDNHEDSERPAPTPQPSDAP